MQGTLSQPRQPSSRKAQDLLGATSRATKEALSFLKCTLHAPRLNLEPYSQGGKHPSSSQPKTINAAQRPQPDTKKQPTGGEINIEDTNLEVEGNSGSLRPSSSLNSTLPQCEDLDRANRISRAQYLQHQGKRPRSQSTPTEDEFLNIKNSTYNHLLYTPNLQRPRRNSEAPSPGEQIHQ